jgi:hypothetical protein
LNKWGIDFEPIYFILLFKNALFKYFPKNETPTLTI